MRTSKTRLMLALPAAMALTVAGATGASAHGGGHGGHGGAGTQGSLGPASTGNSTYQINLTDTMGNDSGSQATARISLNGDAMTVNIQGTGFTPNSPHAQHFHGSFSDNQDFTCPTSASDKDGDGQVNTEEGLPQYGDIVISLTTTGDTSKSSGLAVDRMPKADADGNLSYSRTIQLPSGGADKLRNLHVVQHGLDANGNGKYDADALGESTFAKSLGVSGIPEEATNPATCGTIRGASAGAPATGGVQTGGASTGGTEALGVLGLGVAAAAGAGGMLAYRRRLARR